MTEVVFLDSSVLFNILEVPHKCSDRASVVAEFTQLAGNGATFIFPMTAVIETDNAITVGRCKVIRPGFVRAGDADIGRSRNVLASLR